MRIVTWLIYVHVLFAFSCGILADEYQPLPKPQALEALIPHLDAAAKEQPVECVLSFAGKKQTARLQAATAKDVSLQIGGNQQTVPWALLDAEDVVALGKAAVRVKQDRALALADFSLAAGLKNRALEALDLAAACDGAGARGEDLNARRSAAGGVATRTETPGGQETGKAEVKKEEPAAVQVTATDDWYCPGYNAAHTYTSKDQLPLPLKLKWHWEMPEGKAHQVLCSGGKVFIKGRHSNSTPIGDRVGVHNYVVNLETGQTEKEDPDGTSPNDWCENWAGGIYEGRIYQADDGGPPFCGADVWGPINIDPDQKTWVVVQHKRVDGPSPGVYCMPLGKGVGQKRWWVGHQVDQKDMKTYCMGDVAIGPGAVYAIIDWKVSDPALKSGLICHEIDSGKERWHVAGEYQAVSAGPDFCVAVSKDRVMGAYAAKDGAVLWRVPLAADPECHPMVAGEMVRVYDGAGSLTTFKIQQKGEKWVAAPDGGPVRIGRFQGPKVKGCNNSCFCYSADGTLYIANGATVMGFKKGQKPWQWVPPPDVAKLAQGLGHPIIARGMLFAVGSGGVLCFEHEDKKK